MAARLLPSEAVGKLLLITPLLVAGSTAYHAVPVGGFVSRATASAIFMMNPFVYGRLHYGQLLLLVGYALLPWIATRVRKLLAEPTAGNGIWLGSSLVLISALSLHVFVIAVSLAGCLLAAWALIGFTQPRTTPPPILPILAALAAVAIGTSYWLLPIMLGHGSQAAEIGGIGAGDLGAFAALPDERLGLVPNLLGLYGFWAEGTDRFTSMKHFVPLWPAILALLVTLSLAGVSYGLMARNGLRRWVGGLSLMFSIALFLEMGVSNPASAGVVTWLDSHFTLYRGMRDAGKWAAALALVYSQLGGLGANAILERLSKQRAFAESREWAGPIATALLLVVPIYYGNGLLFGSHAEIRPSQYPNGWYQADRALIRDPNPERTLFLPWHEYMSYSFIHNQNSVVASPAVTFFSVPILASANPEVPGIAPPNRPDQVAVAQLVANGPVGEWAHVLETQNVKYVLLARELDWKTYEYLNAQRDIVKVADFGSIVLYRNDLVGGSASGP
jgi:hypothetical protein